MEPKEYDIEFVRGDTCPITFNLVDAEGNELDSLDNANVYFTVKNTFNDANYLFQKTYLGGTISKEGNKFSLTILPADTEGLNYGRYVYDICVVSSDNTIKSTLVRGSITLTNEVTFATNE
jgi:hypothetical protein